MTSLQQLNAALSGRYRIERELGGGGMAMVYLARDERHDRNVALKVLRPELAAVIGAERFLNEIKTTANLQHPREDDGERAAVDRLLGGLVELVRQEFSVLQGRETAGVIGGGVGAVEEQEHSVKRVIVAGDGLLRQRVPELELRFGVVGAELRRKQLIDVRGLASRQDQGEQQRHR